MEVSFLDLGGVITNIVVPDKNGVFEDVVLGYDDVSSYEINGPSFGAPVGRYANRISNAGFKLNGKDDFLPRLGYTAIGDKFTTNCLAYEDSEFSTEDLAITALKACATTTIYGCACDNGAIKITKEAPAYGPVYRVIKAHTMPDGQFGVQFQHIPEIAG